MPSIAITEQGISEWTIAVRSNASKTEQFAAEELRNYIERMSGARLAIVGGNPAAPMIWVAMREHLANCDTLPAAAEGYDGYAISIARDAIVIAGENERGVLYGAYDLLEHLGCRWFHPIIDPNDPEVVPRNPDLVLEAGAWAEAAKVEYRWFNGAAFFNEMIEDRQLAEIDWAAKNRFNGVSWQADTRPNRVEIEMLQMRDQGALDALSLRSMFLQGPGHCFPFFLPEEKYFADHPEWYGMNDKGERRPPRRGEWPIMNHCWSNDAANDALIANMIDFCKRWPQLTVLLAVWVDGGQVCRCDECRKRGGADLIIELFNKIADRLEEETPHVTLESVLGYPPIEEVPTGSQPNGKWRGLYAHWGRNHSTNANDPDYAKRPNLLTWASYFPNAFEHCSYYATSSHQTFHSPPFLHAHRGDTDFIIEQKVKGTLVMQYPFGFRWNFSFNLALAGLCPFYPQRQPIDMLRDYAMHYFGSEAGPLLYEYLQMLGARGHNLEVSYRASTGNATDADMQWLAEMRKMLARAAYLVREEPIFGYRVAKQMAAHDVVTRWAVAHNVRKEAEKALEEWKAGALPSEPVQARIAEARAWSDEFLQYAAQIEQQYPGTSQADWLKSWWVDRTFTSAIDSMEKCLLGETQESKSARPDHVGGVD